MLGPVESLDLLLQPPKQVSSRLPKELWTDIAWYAIAPWPSDAFFPPKPSRKDSTGFRGTCKMFKKIWKRIVASIVHLHEGKSYPKLSSVTKHILVTKPTDLTWVLEMFLAFSPLRPETLSIYNAEPFIRALEETGRGDTAARRCISVSMSTVSRLEIRSEIMPDASRLRKFFPNLTALRVGADWSSRPGQFLASLLLRSERIFTNANDFADAHAAFPQLRHLTLDVAADNVREFEWYFLEHGLTASHKGASRRRGDHCIAHYECSICYPNYNHASLRAKEDTVARALAQRLPGLECVTFLDFWPRTWSKKPQRRWLYITRRDDGGLHIENLQHPKTLA